MHKAAPVLLALSINACLYSCTSSTATNAPNETAVKPLLPTIVTQPVTFDTDDPAIWVDPVNHENSLIVGTDKDENGGLYVFNLKGEIQKEKTQLLKRPDNVDIEYGLMIGGRSTDVAVATERMTHKLRLFSLPDMRPIDNGGIEMFEGETGDMYRDLMGISLYKHPVTKEIFAIVGRKQGPSGSYLWQYKLEDDGKGGVKGTIVRKFGNYSGKKEVEAIAVDDKLGYVYYSDEGFGVRKYYADPSKGNEELAAFGTTGFANDHEGISIYEVTDSTGYILVSDQGANQFFIFPREGSAANPHEHVLKKVVLVSATQSDGSDITSVPLNSAFAHGLFVAMSNDKTFHYYRWEDIAGSDLVSHSNQPMQAGQ